MTPEGNVKRKVTAVLKEYGVWYFMPRGTTFGRSGIPDYVCCVNGRMLCIETKAGNNKPTALQLVEHQRLRDAGAVVLVVNEDRINTVRVAIEAIRQGLSASPAMD